MRSSFYVSGAHSRSLKNHDEPVSFAEAVRIYLTILCGVTVLMLTYYYWISPALLANIFR